MYLSSNIRSNKLLLMVTPPFAIDLQTVSIMEDNIYITSSKHHRVMSLLPRQAHDDLK
jgi:hypothetical protein